MRAAAALGTLLLAILTGCGSSGSSTQDQAEPADPPAAQAEATPPAPPTPSPPAAPEQPPAAVEEDSPHDEARTSEPGESNPPAAAPTRGELEEIVRAWSAALNTGDNQAAADLFAPDALVAQGGGRILLESRADAVRFNSGLPCSGSIVELEFRSNTVTALFELGDRPMSECDAAPGTLAAARFVIEDGLIVIWQQLPVATPRPRDPPPAGTLA